MMRRIAQLRPFAQLKKSRKVSVAVSNADISISGDAWPVVPRDSTSIQESKESTPATVVPAPTSLQLRRHWLNSAVPMAGFGLMDNFVMIQAGDLIDNTIGVHLGLATLAAAACGQMISDTCGVCFGGFIERLASKMGLPRAHLTDEQLQLQKVKNVGIFGAAVGVLLGCGLGMTSLFFKDLEKAERQKRNAELRTLFEAIAAHGSRSINAEYCTLWMIEDDKKHVSTQVQLGYCLSGDNYLDAFRAWDTDCNGVIMRAEMQYGLKNMGRNKSDSDIQKLISAVNPRVPGQLDCDEFKKMMELLMNEEVVLPLSMNGIKGQAYQSKKIVNVSDEDFLSRTRGTLDKYSGFKTQSLLLSPVITPDGEVVAFVEMVNKRGLDGKVVPFGESDEKLIDMLSVHAAIFIQQARG